MSQTKVTDNLRDTTQLDATKITTGTIPEARITSLDATKLTGTINNARISLDEAEIPNLGTAKVTSGTFADARISESSVTQHVTGYDDATIKADILKLAIHQATEGNRVEFNLTNSYIDGFERDDGLTTQTNVDRNTSGEYVASVYVTSTTFTPSSVSDWDGDTGSYNYASGSLTPTSGDNGVRLASAQNFTGDFEWEATITDPNSQLNWGVYDIANDSSWSNTAPEIIGTLGGWWYKSGQTDLRYGTTNVLDYDHSSGGVIKMTRVGGVIKVFEDNILKHTFTQESTNTLRMAFPQDGGISNSSYTNITTTQSSTTSNATGTLISDPQTASSSRTSCSGVIVYEDAEGTATLGTDLKIYFTANNGSNWTEAASYATAVTYSGTKKLVTLGSTTVTAGTQIALKAEWANQEVGSGTEKTVTAVDNAHHDNGQAKFGSTSLYCDGTNDSIEVSDSSDFAFTGDYTVEFWVYFNGTPSNNTHFAGQGTDSAANFAFFFRCDSGGNFSAGTSNGSTQRLITSSTDMTNAWHHVALVKNGTSMKLYIEGTSEGTPVTHSDIVQNVSYPFEFGGGNNSNSHVNAWFDEIRISKVARYTGNFTPPTSVFSADANTVLLIHCDGSNGTSTFTDSSTVTGKVTHLHGWAVNY